MKNFFKKLGFIAIIAGVLITSSPITHASGNKFIVTDIQFLDAPTNQIHIHVMITAGSDLIDHLELDYIIGNYTTEKQIHDDIITNAVAVLVTAGYPDAEASDILFVAPTLSPVGISNNASDLTLDSTHRLVTDSEKTTWNAKGSGTVTSVTAGTGLSGGTITGTGTVSMPNTGTAGTYGSVTTDAQGRVTAGKRMEAYSGTTNGSGVYTVTFSTAYSVAPNIQANIIGATDTQNLRITSISTTGFTVTARNRTDVVGLLPSYSNVSGASVDVLITEK